ncbi:SIR2 family NAD-dependent protein deacylase [Fodinibius sediminis]|uniref:SIR2-like domain-containing protein n=1 Tax=Fodinibius sediminis TaxID=1214077 RepID=A0A521FD29_9BACT|nr:SIR2 family protein [Fodinibius sediminis]SMO94118.1 SIR2-like domain-containing protein [Fodinibius sediminis]
MSAFKNQLKKHLYTFETVPYLFVGPGLSRRYTTLPSQRALLQNLCEAHLPHSFDYYEAKATSLPEACSLVAEAFDEIGRAEERFGHPRDASTGNAEEREWALKYELANLMDRSMSTNPEWSDEIALLSTIHIDGIITTNWDAFLESVLEDFSVYIGQSELLFSNVFHVGNIFKIHGCTSRPQSMVVTQRDHDTVSQKRDYLAAKLVTLFIEQPIIFMGYSLQDPTIQGILKSLLNCLDDNNLNKLRGKFIFCEWVEGLETPSLQSGEMVIPGSKDHETLPIKHVRMDSFMPLYEVLASIRSRPSVKVLRNMQSMVLDYVKKAKPSDNVRLREFPGLNDLFSES